MKDKVDLILKGEEADAYLKFLDNNAIESFTTELELRNTEIINLTQQLNNLQESHRHEKELNYTFTKWLGDFKQVLDKKERNLRPKNSYYSLILQLEKRCGIDSLEETAINADTLFSFLVDVKSMYYNIESTMEANEKFKNDVINLENKHAKEIEALKSDYKKYVSKHFLKLSLKVKNEYRNYWVQRF